MDICTQYIQPSVSLHIHKTSLTHAVIQFHILLQLNLLQVCQQASHFCAVIRQTMTLTRDRCTSQHTALIGLATSPLLHQIYMVSLPGTKTHHSSLLLSTYIGRNGSHNYLTNVARLCHYIGGACTYIHAYICKGPNQCMYIPCTFVHAFQRYSLM